MTLNSPQISEAAIEGSTLAVLNEWLGSFFDGNEHQIGFGPTATFPKSDLRFQEGVHPQPLGALIGIRIVWVTATEPRLRWEVVDGPNLGLAPASRQQVAKHPVTWMFWVRAESATREASQKAAADAAQLLFAILNNSAASGPMTACGIHHLRTEQPQMGGVGGGAKQEDPFYALRFLKARATLRYPVMSQGPDTQ